MNEETTITTQPNLAAKLLRVQQEIGAVSKNSTNPHFRSKYADLNEILSVVKPVLSANGLVLNQPCNKDEHGQYVETRISDITGQYTNSVNYLTGNEDNMQKVGGGITYARRYGLVSLLALEQEDDDGESAVGRKVEVAKPATTAKTPNPTTAPRTPVNLASLAKQTVRVAVDKKVTTEAELIAKFGKTKMEERPEAEITTIINYVKGLL